jgi:hypothetical protein
LGQNATADAWLYLRPESGFIVRGAAIGAAQVALALTLLYVFGPRINETSAQTAAAILVVFPGLFSAYAARTDEHPLATELVYGLRALAFTPAVLALVGGSLLVLEKTQTPSGLVAFILAWCVFAVLAVAWRLAGRGRPDPAAL